MRAIITVRAGFTLAEMILVVSILAILLAISTPSIFGFIKQRDIQQEENTLQEMRRALQAYLADKNTMPQADNLTTPGVEWAQDLAGYTNLSIAQMTTDEWGSPRSFIKLVDNTRKIQGSDVSVNYATFMSSGPDRTVQAVAQAIPATGNVFADATNAGWWANQATIPTGGVAKFGQLATTGDDLMVKFTDYAEKLSRYNLTLQRMDRIANAVESIARVRYSEVVSYCATTGLGTCGAPGAIELTIYYPIGIPSNLTGWDESYHRYKQIYDTGTVAAADQVRVRNGETDVNRRTDMVKLMRLLGLPDDFCCSALEMASDNLPKPFFYFSNPRPRGISGGCGARPGGADQKLPARLATVNNDSASPPTCG